MLTTRNQKFYIGTTRFNNKTWNENERWRTNKSFNGCIYNSPKTMAYTIPQDSTIFILEMNNDINKIMGIGLIKNKLETKHHHIYEDRNYNRYTYKGNQRKDRMELTKEQANILETLEIIVFKGKKHLKRGQGITLIPQERLINKDFLEFFTNLFVLTKRNDNYEKNDNYKRNDNYENLNINK